MPFGTSPPRYTGISKKVYTVSQKKVWCSKLTIIIRMVYYRNVIF